MKILLLTLAILTQLSSLTAMERSEEMGDVRPITTIPVHTAASIKQIFLKIEEEHLKAFKTTIKNQYKNPTDLPPRHNLQIQETICRDQQIIVDQIAREQTKVINHLFTDQLISAQEKEEWMTKIKNYQHFNKYNLEAHLDRIRAQICAIPVSYADLYKSSYAPILKELHDKTTAPWESAPTILSESEMASMLPSAIAKQEVAIPISEPLAAQTPALASNQATLDYAKSWIVNLEHDNQIIERFINPPTSKLQRFKDTCTIICCDHACAIVSTVSTCCTVIGLGIPVIIYLARLVAS